MAEEPVTQREGSLTHLTLHRPDKANALSLGLTKSLLDAFETAATDGTRLVVMDEAGKSFCSGFDLSDFDSISDGDLVLRLVRIETLLQAVYHATFPTMTLAHGEVVGVGADLVCTCNAHVADPGSRFRMPGLAFGIVLGTRQQAAHVGTDVAREIQAAL